VFVHTVGSVHPLLKDNSYDVVLDDLLRKRRETFRCIFASPEITLSDFATALNGARDKHNDVSLVLDEIDRSGYLGLEEFVRDRLLSEGLNAAFTPATGDGGADIVVRDELGEIVYLIQCKHTTNVDIPIDAGLVEDVKRVRHNWRAPAAVVIGVSNAKRFSQRVINAFKQINGRLIGRDELTNFDLGNSQT
jgi:hypothetical protein